MTGGAGPKVGRKPGPEPFAKKYVTREIAAGSSEIASLKTQDRCIDARLDALETWASNNGQPALTKIQLRPLLWSLHSSAWEVAKVGQAASHMSVEQQIQFADLYDRLANEREIILSERAAWVRIDAIANRKSLDDAHFSRLQDEIAEAREYARARRLNYQSLDATAQELAIKPLQLVRGGQRNDDLCQPL